ncbi:hypothetical protein L861_04165 [Litchfieldella anticariensis FP35 = DSM 16096]|uniref:DUF2789 domain-containing protein n=1 Tax=Litchfieldella anticariensis (strain DSM 16096 / CECT 5854 / CIP 108499 / LMG 22089 / FP35) TaxID=1121939 RepID=S2L9I8_LITA3|nr:DUF2789 domain-containing protein [Halomonas anticariensis]EPC04524.1 hypothetical protein L861_04165 [Halomonas anticariensis FP35 = DSM 16096]
MEQPVHHFSELFEQLGLPSDATAIEQFIKRHAPLPDEIALADAPFWNEAQANFLHDALEEDADWAEVVDHLDASLRKP